jgi:hypothetical protein
MCYAKNMNDFLQRIQTCTDTDEMRRLLQAAHF